MTDNYKTKLLKYLTGNLDAETGTDEPQFDIKTKTGNFMQYLEEQLLSIYTYPSPSVVGCLSNEKYSNNIIYGFYNNGSEYKGFILIANDKYEPIQLITSFDSGTDFRVFEALNVDENGNVWGVDSSGQGQAANPADFRFIMLNNIFISGTNTSNYYVKLRSSYYFPDAYQTSLAGYIMDAGRSQGDTLYKKIGSADYYMSVGKAIVSLEINVGESNKWTIAINNAIGNSSCTIYPIYNNDNFYLTISARKVNSSSLYDYAEYLYTAGDEPTITPKMSISSFANKTLSSWIKINENICYVAYTDVVTTGNPQNGYIYKINYSNNTLELIYTINSILYDFGLQIYFSKKNNIPFITVIGEKNAGSALDEWQRKFGIIYEDSVYLVPITTVESFMTVAGDVYINNQYNLYKIYVFNDYTQSSGSHDEVTLIFNQNNYNGLPYEATNCLVPFSGILYDNSDNIIFARNLYNKTVSGQTTTSVVQIPNTLLNDVTIARNDLIGQTNETLVSDNTQFTKNIYETVDLNFSNTLIIRNDNNLDNKILNPIGASRLNDSVSQTTDYYNAQATKIKINYADNTNRIIQLDSSQIKLMSNTVAKYLFSIYVNKEISNIQIISYDENTIYQTIEGLNLTVGNIYRFIQYVSTTGEIVKNNVLYNGEQVNYDGEAVIYIN